jgi:hypothetical protein
MRKLILISAFVLASVSAQAGESRNMTLAANDETKAVETAKPEVTAAPQTNVDAKTDAAKTDAAKTDAPRTDVAKTDVAKPEASKPRVAKQPRYHVRGYEADEAKARRIAARYGVYW